MAIAAALRLVDDARRFRRLAREARAKNDRALGDQHAGTVNKKFDEIGAQLGIVFAGETWGTKAKPIPIKWPGPAAAKYPVLYFGGRIKKPRKQSMMKGMHSKRQKDETGTPITEYVPPGGGKLEGGETLGLSLVLGPGTVVGPLCQETTPGGSKLDREIAPYGYSADDGMQLDHVQEIQMGGRDDITNLWPLEAGRNASKGSTLARMPVEFPEKATLGIPELKRLPPPGKGKQKGFYFEIKSVTG